MIDYIIIDNDLNARSIYNEVINTIMFTKKINYQIHEFNKTTKNINKIITTSDNLKIYIIDIKYNQQIIFFYYYMM